MDGILNIYKPINYTSYSIVDIIKKKFGIKKIGHGGSLDPFAEGVLLLLINNGTFLFDVIQYFPKVYYAQMELGKTTDTLDTEGKILTEKEVTVSNIDIQNVLLKYIGIYNQKVPQYSAAKHKGKPLYELAREGKEIPVKYKKVTIYDLQFVEYQKPFLTIRVNCSSGTYVRQLASDIGNDLGTGAYLTKLMRTSIGEFNIKDSISVKDLESGGYSLANKIIPIETVIQNIEKIQVNDNLAKKILNGLNPESFLKYFNINDLPKDFFIVVNNKRILALLRKINNKYKYFRVFNNEHYYIK